MVTKKKIVRINHPILSSASKVLLFILIAWLSFTQGHLLHFLIGALMGFCLSAVVVVEKWSGEQYNGKK